MDDSETIAQTAHGDDFEDAPCGYIVTGPMGHFRRANRAFCEWTEYSASELIGMLLQDLLTSAGRLYFEYSVAPLLRTQRVVSEVSLELACKDGHPLPVLMNCQEVHDAVGHPLELRATFTRIGDRSRYERDLLLAKMQAEQAQKRVHLLAQTSDILAQSVRDTTALQQVATLCAHHFVDGCAIDLFRLGKAARIAASHRRGAFVGVLRSLKPPSIHVPQPLLLSHPGDAVQAAEPHLRSYLDALAVLLPQSIILTPLYERHKNRGTLVLLTEHGGQPLGPTDIELAWEIAQRISVALDNMRLFKDNVHAIKTRDDFMSICSHEFNTPLQAMKLKSQTARRRLQRKPQGEVPAADVEQFIASIDVQVGRLARLVGDMLDLARVRGGKLTLSRAPVELTELVRRAVESLKPELERAENTITFRDDGPLWGQWNAFRLEQVVLNLLTNAMKYGPRAPIHITCRHRGRHAVLHIRDHGRGIAEEDQERVFRRFERSVSRSEVSGLGLGLYISQEIVRAHGGNIRIRSKLGSGAAFIVAIPTRMPARKRQSAGAHRERTCGTSDDGAERFT